MPARSHERERRILELVKVGWFRAAISKELGVFDSVVDDACARNGVRCQDGRRLRKTKPMNATTAAEFFEYRSDGRLILRVCRGNKRAGDLAGHIKKDGYRCIVHQGRQIAAHRIVWLLHHGYIPERLDHINGIRDDNRIENLREATSAQNSANMNVVWGGVKLKGVTKLPYGKFQAACRAKYLGVFETAAEAARAYDAAAVAHFGEFAKTNVSLGLIHG